VWDELRKKHFHSRVFDSLDVLENQLEVALHTFENNAPMVKSIVTWEWIAIALLNCKWNYLGRNMMNLTYSPRGR